MKDSQNHLQESHPNMEWLRSHYSTEMDFGAERQRSQ